MKKLFGLFLALLVAAAPVNVGRATLVSLPSPIYFPGIFGTNGGAPALATGITLSSAGHYVAYVFVAREDMVVSHVGIRAGTATGSPTLTMTIETLDSATGLPNGAGFGSSSGTTGTVTSNTNVLQALGASATIPRGTTFAAKVALASGTSQVIQNMNAISLVQTSGLPYQVNNTGTPTKTSLNNNFALIALGSSATTFYQLPGAIPLSASATNNFNNSTAGAKRGLLFTPPMNGRVIGIKWFGANAVGSYNACMFDFAGAELSNSCTAFDGLNNASATNGINHVFFDNPVTVTAGTSYRVAIEPTTTTNTIVATLTLPSTDYRSASPAGTTAQYTTFTTAGGWVDSGNETLLPVMDVIMDQVDNGAGSGGGGASRCIGC